MKFLPLHLLLGVGSEGARPHLREDTKLQQTQSDAPGVKDAFGAIREHVEKVTEQQKGAGAERLADVGRAVHDAADKLAKEIPQAGIPIHSAADAIENLAQQLRERSVDDLAGSFNDVARKQPIASFAACVLAGFALTHFLKSSTPGRSR